MQATVIQEGSKSVIKLVGRFDFNTHREFRGVSDPIIADSNVREIEISFREVEYLDSSALGMLLMLRDKASGAGKDISLVGVKGSVKQVLEIANFGKLFKIS